MTGEQLTLGEALRDEGMRRTTEAADDQDIAVIDQAIDELNRRREPWSANQLRALLPEVRQPLIGARVRAKARRREMRRVGFEPSDLPSTHAHHLTVWMGGAR